MGFFKPLCDTIKLFSRPKSDRRIIFYSEGKAYWPHLEPVLKAFLERSALKVCYVSSAADDPGLSLNHALLTHFRLDEGWVRNHFFEHIDTDILVMTMPDLHQYQVKRSKFPVHYVYIHHSLVSHHMVYRPGAFDHFDTIFCSGPHHIKEIEVMRKHAGLQPIQLVKHGYGRLDTILADATNSCSTRHDPAHLLIAPSWGPHGLIETRGKMLIQSLLDTGYTVTLRPHPQTQKFSADIIKHIQDTWNDEPRFALDLETEGQQSLLHSDLMITDWSGAAFDYAFGMEKPVLFIDTPRKVNNAQYTDIPLDPIEVRLREHLGAVISLDALDQLSDRIQSLLNTPHTSSKLQTLRNQHVYNIGRSGLVGAMALQNLLSI